MPKTKKIEENDLHTKAVEATRESGGILGIIQRIFTIFCVIFTLVIITGWLLRTNMPRIKESLKPAPTLSQPSGSNTVPVPTVELYSLPESIALLYGSLVEPEKVSLNGDLSGAQRSYTKIWCKNGKASFTIKRGEKVYVVMGQGSYGLVNTPSEQGGEVKLTCTPSGQTYFYYSIE